MKREKWNGHLDFKIITMGIFHKRAFGTYSETPCTESFETVKRFSHAANAVLLVAAKKFLLYSINYPD